MINVTSSTGATTLLPNARLSAQDSFVTCYPPDFGCAQVGILSVFVSNSAREVPQLVGTPNRLVYVSNVVCAAKCILTGNGLGVGEHS